MIYITDVESMTGKLFRTEFTKFNQNSFISVEVCDIKHFMDFHCKCNINVKSCALCFPPNSPNKNHSIIHDYVHEIKAKQRKTNDGKKLVIATEAIYFVEL